MRDTYVVYGVGMTPATIHRLGLGPIAGIGPLPVALDLREAPAQRRRTTRITTPNKGNHDAHRSTTPR